MIWAGFTAALTSCSTVRPSPSKRIGLLDRIAQLDRNSPQGRRTPAVVRNTEEEGVASAKLMRGFLRWPLSSVQVTSPFGQRGASFHEGLDLRAPVGTPILAAQGGTVIYAGSRIRGYGRMVVISHLNGITTIYAHQSRLFVRKGQRVKQGQRIGLSGNTGHSTGPHLHFEVRTGVAALDPLRVMPSSETAAAEVSPASKVRSRRRVAMR